MPGNWNSIRLGAPDVLMLDWATPTPIDLGFTTGGAALAVNSTYLPIEVDQCTMPAAAYKTKEEYIFSFAGAQTTVPLVAAGLSLGTDLITTTVAGPMTTPTTPVITTGGTAGAVAYSYQIAAVGPNGDSIPSIAGTTSTGNAILTATNFNTITWPANAGAFLGYRVIRSASAGSPATTGLIATLGPGVTTFNDTGLAATAYTPTVTNPANPTMDTLAFGGRLAVPFHTLDWQVPRNDGTGNKWVGHLNRVFSSKTVTLDYKRDAPTQVNKYEFMALADTTQLSGHMAGFLGDMHG